MERNTARQFQIKYGKSAKGGKPILGTNLLKTEEKNYLNCYWFDYFSDMRAREIISMCEDPLQNHPDTTKYLRAHFIDWLFHALKCLEKQDTTIPYMALNMMDRYY